MSGGGGSLMGLQCRVSGVDAKFWDACAKVYSAKPVGRVGHGIAGAGANECCAGSMLVLVLVFGGWWCSGGFSGVSSHLSSSETYLVRSIPLLLLTYLGMSAKGNVGLLFGPCGCSFDMLAKRVTADFAS